MERKLINIKDAAKLLGVSPLTLRNWDKNGKLKALRHPMNNYRVYKYDDITKLLDSMNTNPIIRPKVVPPRPKKLSVRHIFD